MATNNAANFPKPINVANGGSGASSFTTYAPLCGGTTSTGILQQGTTNFSVSGDVLTSNGASALPSWKKPGSPIKITTLTASVSATLTFTSSDITNAYNLYLIEITRLVSLAGGTLRVLFSTNNGVSYLATGYQCCTFRNAYNTATLSRTSSTAVGSIATLTNGTDTISATLYFNAASGVPSIFIGRGSSYASTGTTLSNHFMTGSNTNNSINNIQFLMSTGTLTSGTITLYGITN